MVRGGGSITGMPVCCEVTLRQQRCSTAGGAAAACRCDEMAAMVANTTGLAVVEASSTQLALAITLRVPTSRDASDNSESLGWGLRGLATGHATYRDRPGAISVRGLQHS